MNKISKAVICRRVVVTPPLRDTSPQSHDLRVVLFPFIFKSNLLLTKQIVTAGFAPARHSFNAVFLLIKDLIGKGTNSH
jgi:hypothetical protein